MEVGGQRHSPAAVPPGMTRYPSYRRLGGTQSRSGRLRKISPPQGIDPRTVQPAASRYTALSRATARVLVLFIVLLHCTHTLPSVFVGPVCKERLLSCRLWRRVVRCLVMLLTFSKNFHLQCSPPCIRKQYVPLPPQTLVGLYNF